MTEISEVRELTPREVSVLKRAAWALWTGAGEGRFLANGGYYAAAKRLIELDLCREVPTVKLLPPLPKSIVIECTNPGFQLYRHRHAPPSEKGTKA